MVHLVFKCVNITAIGELMYKILFLLFMSIQISYATEYSLTQPVNDYAKLLTDSEKSSLSSKLMEQYKKTNTQIAILTIDSLEGDSIENFSMKMVTKYKLGLKGVDNGVLFIIAMKERKTRIEVGRGLEGTLTDLKSSHILRDSRSFLKDKKYGEGFNFIIDNIIDTIHPDTKVLEDNKEKTGSVAVTTKSDNKEVTMFFNLLLTFVVFFFWMLAVFHFGREALSNYKEYKLYKEALALYNKNKDLLEQLTTLEDENTTLSNTEEDLHNEIKVFNRQIKASNQEVETLNAKSQELQKTLTMLKTNDESYKQNPLLVIQENISTSNNKLLIYLIKHTK